VAILVDYHCTDCGGRAEHWTASPPPASVPCIACGAQSRRLFAAVGLSGSGSTSGAGGRAAHHQVEPSAAARFAEPALCSQYPQIPGLCHMSESAGRMWVAKYTRDSRAVDREQERQENQAAVAPPTMADAISHRHAAPAVPPPTGA
jgi:hypothetical protein